MSNENYYDAGQVEKFERAAWEAAMSEAGKEWERQQGEYYEREATLETRIAELEHIIEIKNDSLESYAEFYNQIAVACGLPRDTLPGAVTDNEIINYINSLKEEGDDHGQY